MQAMKRILRTAPGLVLALLIAIPAWFLGRAIPIAGAPIFSIVMGMTLSFFRRPPALEEDIAYAGKKILQYPIVFLGFGLDLGLVAKVGLEFLSVMLFTIAASLSRPVLGIGPDAAAVLSEIGKFGIGVAMAAIGLRSNPLKLVRRGAKPMPLGAACWAAVAIVGLAVQRLGS